MKLSGRRPVWKIATVLAVTVGVVLTGSATATATTAAEPAVVVSPATNLGTGQSVAVSATGFPAGQFVAFSECGVTDTQKPACRLENTHEITADAHGKATTSLAVYRTFTGSDLNTGETLGNVNCAVGQGCTVIAVNHAASGVVTFAYTPIRFRPCD